MHFDDKDGETSIPEDVLLQASKTTSELHTINYINFTSRLCERYVKEYEEFSK